MMKRTELQIYLFVKKLLKESKQRAETNWLSEVVSHKEKYKQQAYEDVLNFIGTIRIFSDSTYGKTMSDYIKKDTEHFWEDDKDAHK